VQRRAGVTLCERAADTVPDGTTACVFASVVVVSPVTSARASGATTIEVAAAAAPFGANASLPGLPKFNIVPGRIAP
jgi:hypothetical protein